jgi:hypothetical protein
MARNAELQKFQMDALEMEALLQKAADALWECAKAALAVKPALDEPYKDDPRWTPWTRWVEQPSSRAHELKRQITRYLASHNSSGTP